MTNPTSESIHTCSYYCERPECIKRQRDELVKEMEAREAVDGRYDERTAAPIAQLEAAQSQAAALQVELDEAKEQMASDEKEIQLAQRDAYAFKGQAAAMAGLLEEAQNCIHSAGQFLKRHPATVKELMPFVEETENMWERINAALATWKGSGKDLP